MSGGVLTINSECEGSLQLSDGTVVIARIHLEELPVGSGGVIIVKGTHYGPTHVTRHGVVHIERRGKLAGPLNNEGLIFTRGILAAAREGRGCIRVEENGTIEVPMRAPHGGTIYD